MLESYFDDKDTVLFFIYQDRECSFTRATLIIEALELPFGVSKIIP